MDQPSQPTLDELADLLRSCSFAIEHASTALIAFVDKRYLEAASRDHDQRQVRAAVAAAQQDGRGIWGLCS